DEIKADPRVREAYLGA
ncbi:MAG: hypothetical protein ACREEE_13300, partial [Dongiaceae bacterium]